MTSSSGLWIGPSLAIDGTTTSGQGGGGVAPVSSFGPAKAKLVAGQNITIFVNGDSTSYSDFGWVPKLMTAIAIPQNCTVIYYLWAEWNVSAPSGPKAYKAPVTLRTGTGPTITVYNASTPGQVSSYIFDGSRKPTALDAIPTPDLCIMHMGMNMTSYNILAPGLYQSGTGLFFATLGMLEIQWPGVPQLLTTQNPHRDDNGFDTSYQAIVRTVAKHPSSVGIVDTAQEFVNVGKAAIYYRNTGDPLVDNIHPSDTVDNSAGATLISNAILKVWNSSVNDGFTTPSWPVMPVTNLLSNGDLSNWTGSFPVRMTALGGATVSKDTVNTYGGAAYSMAIVPNGTINAGIQYSANAAEYNQWAGKTMSFAVLYKQSGTQPQAVFNFFTRVGGTLRGFVQGGLVSCWDGWMWSVVNDIPADATQDANDGIRMFVTFNTTPTTNDPMWVQKIIACLGPIPLGGLTAGSFPDPGNVFFTDDDGAILTDDDGTFLEENS